MTYSHDIYKILLSSLKGDNNMSEFITSAGLVGTDYYRSDCRAYRTEELIATSSEMVLDEISTLSRGAHSKGRRRWVWRGVVRRQVADDLVTIERFSRRHDNWRFPDMGKIEVIIPLSILGGNSSRRLLVIADNIHRSNIPEWQEVYDFWRQPYSREVNPVDRIKAIQSEFRMVNDVTEDDINDLVSIWRPFGWSENGVREFIERYYTQSGDSRDLWFSGVRNRSNNKLVSACQGESIHFGGIHLIEATEFGTEPSYEKRGLCTASASGLIAQILRDTFYETNNREKLHRSFITPLVYSELSMTTRSDVIARKVGMTIPLTEGIDGLNRPRQVLRRNVAVLDGHQPNNLSLEELVRALPHPDYAENLGNTYNYWRNFITGVLSREAIDRYYSEDQCRGILNYYE